MHYICRYICNCKCIQVMEKEQLKVKYPQNLYLKEKIRESGQRHDYLAKKIGIEKSLLSRLINGHYKGTNIIPKLLEQIAKTTDNE